MELAIIEIKRRCGHVEKIRAEPSSSQARWAKRCNCLKCTPVWPITYRCGCNGEYQRDLRDTGYNRMILVIFSLSVEGVIALNESELLIIVPHGKKGMHKCV